MHNNYYFLRQLTPCLAEFLLDSRLQAAFSQNRDELVLEFVLPDPTARSFYLKAYLDPKFCCLQVPQRFHRARKNSVDLFPEVQQAAVTRVRQFENERSFAIYLQSADGTSYQLLFKMHGNRANVILFKEEQVVALFKNALAKDAALQLTELDRFIEATYEQFEAAAGKPSAVYPTLGKIPKQFLLDQGYDALPQARQWELLQDTVRQLEVSQKFYVTIV
ncbi:MAG: hypothetical protein WA960_18950, partial [Tunicatimonas sp.]